MNIFFAFLGLLFIGLKLTGHITWSWWLVLLPVYGPIAFALTVFVVAFIMVVVKDRR